MAISSIGAAATMPTADPTEMAHTLYSTAAMLEVLHSHLQRLLGDGLLDADLASPLTRVTDLCRERIEQVANVVCELEFAPAKGRAA